MAEAKATFNVPGMSCMHCVKAIKTALGQLNGVADVAVDLGAKKVVVKYQGGAITEDVLAKALATAGYPVAS